MESLGERGNEFWRCPIGLGIFTTYCQTQRGSCDWWALDKSIRALSLVGRDRNGSQGAWVLALGLSLLSTVTLGKLNFVSSAVRPEFYYSFGILGFWLKEHINFHTYLAFLLAEYLWKSWARVKANASKWSAGLARGERLSQLGWAETETEHNKNNKPTMVLKIESNI